jgi:threonine synthase
MDISKASNFERFIFDLLDRDAGKTQDLFDRQLNTNGFFTLAQEKEFASVKNIFGFVSGKSSHADRLRTIREVYQQHAQIIDPHTADGLKVAQEFLVKDEPMVVLETALPVKFSDTIQEAIDCQPDLPEKFKDLDAMALRYEIMPPDVEQVKSFIAQHC